MKIPASQPITAAQSRASRFQLGLSQAEVITESGIPGYKLKQFETGRVVPDMPFLKQLADFYTGKGIDLADVTEPSTGEPKPEPSPAKPGGNKVTYVQRPCFYVSDSVSPDLLDQCLERMHHNDERIGALMKKPIRNGFLGGYSDETTKEVQELFAALAESYLLFRLLQGNPLVKPAEGEAPADPESIADLLVQFYSKSPVYTGEPVDGDEVPAKEKPAEEVTQ